jgi:sirohydrochlorin ferrochelatase
MAKDVTKGIIIVDHGSRMAESNQLLETVAAAFAQCFGQDFHIVEPAHMEIAKPDIADAYAACVKRGATQITVVPYFLGPGKHCNHDIPNLTAQAAAAHPGTTFRVAACIGFDDALLNLLKRRVADAAK